MRKRTLGLAVIVGIELCLTSCFERAPEQGASPATNTPPATLQAPVPAPFRDRLLEIAREYETYGKAQESLRWGIVACGVPLSERDLRPQASPPKADMSDLRFSASGDSTTHGRKLYFMFAKQV